MHAILLSLDIAPGLPGVRRVVSGIRTRRRRLEPAFRVRRRNLLDPGQAQGYMNRVTRRSPCRQVSHIAALAGSGS